MKQKSGWHVLVFLTPALVIYTAFSAWPLLATLRLSLYGTDEAGAVSFTGFANFQRLLFDGHWFGAFPPPVPKAGDPCYISDHADIGMGINSASKNKADAKVFLDWMGSKEFAELYTNKATGFFSLSKFPVDVQNPVARQIVGWRAQCKSTIRLNAQIMSRGEPSMENELWNVDRKSVV